MNIDPLKPLWPDPAASDVMVVMQSIREDFVARLWKGILVVSLIGAPLSVSRAQFTGWLPVYSLHLLMMSTVILIVWQRSRLSFQKQASLYLLVLWAIGLPGIFTFGLAASSVWWLVLSCFVASKLYSVRHGLYLAAATALMLSIAAIGFVSHRLQLQMDANLYFAEPSAWVTLLVVTGSFMLTILQSTGAYNRSLLQLLQQVNEQRDQIKQLATHDALTGLPVLRLATDRMQMAFARARRSGKKVAVLFIDLDGFKAINDRYGHAAGDQALRETASRLRNLLRAEDTICRVGGDEFVVALTDLADAISAARVADKIIKTLSVPFSYEGQAMRVGASIGISLFPDQAEGYEVLRRLADEAMYVVKRRGKNGYAFNQKAVHPFDISAPKPRPRVQDRRLKLSAVPAR